MAFPEGWGRKCPLVIQSSQVTSTIANFAVMLTEDTLPSEMLDADGSVPALSTGGDIRFTSDSEGTTQLPCEIEHFVLNNDPANSKVVIWVKLSSISSSANTTFYVWYNKSGETQPARATTYGLENVWNSNYKCVLHMNQSPTNAVDEIIDSTSNLNHGRTYNMGSANLVDGQHGKCLNFAGNQYLRVLHHSSLSITPDLSLQVIGYPTDVTTSYGNWIGKDRNQNTGRVNYRICFVGSTTYITFFQQPTLGWQGWRDSVGASNNTWYNITATKGGSSNPVLYRNNNTVGTCAIGGSCQTTLEAADSNDLMIGAVDILSGSPPITDYFKGKLDQIKIADTNFSAAWVDAEYKNWNSPGTFIIEGTPLTPEIYVIIAETFSSSESITDLHYVDTLAESFTMDDSITLLDLIVILSESFSMNDSISSVSESSLLLSESFSMNDTLSSTEILYLLLQESFSMDDTISTSDIMWGVLQESFTMNDSITTLTNYLTLIQESFSMDTSLAGIIEIIKSLAESFTMNDSIGTLIDYVTSIQESFTVDDDLERYLETTKLITESFTVNESISSFNWSEWLRNNEYKAIKQYYLTLTGSADSTTDIVLPMKSFQGRLRNGDPTFLSCVIPLLNDYVVAINARPNGTLIVSMAYLVDGEEQHREEIISAFLENIKIDEGSVNKSITLSGHKTETFSPKHVIIIAGSYYSLTNGKYTYRITPPDLFLKPGDEVTVQDDNFTVGLITYVVNVERQQMTLTE